MTDNPIDPQSLAGKVRGGERAALARAITLVESSRPSHQPIARALIDALHPHTGGSVRLGITGPPGVGKSTLIGRLGLDLVAQGHRLAVLAVDPSSRVSGGSILADKTRMGALSGSDSAFIRPTAAAGTLGGGARRTGEAILVCEAAGHDVVIVETVGVGQSETSVADLVDVFAVLIPPGGGDELQGLKRGLIEEADLIAVTKADGSLASAAARTAADYRGALNILAPVDIEWSVPVLEISSIAGAGLEEFWAAVLCRRDLLVSRGVLEVRHREQDVRRLRLLVRELVLARHFSDCDWAERLERLEARVRRGEITPGLAADEMVSGPS